MKRVLCAVFLFVLILPLPARAEDETTYRVREESFYADVSQLLLRFSRYEGTMVEISGYAAFDETPGRYEVARDYVCLTCTDSEPVRIGLTVLDEQGLLASILASPEESEGEVWITVRGRLYRKYTEDGYMVTYLAPETLTRIPEDERGERVVYK